MAAKNFMPERAAAQTENAVFENGEEIREQVRKKNPRDLRGMRQVDHAVSCIGAWSITICRCSVVGCPSPGLRMVAR